MPISSSPTTIDATDQGIILDGTGFASGVISPAITKVGNQYSMLYGGLFGNSIQIGLATSTDGVTWTKSSSVPVIGNANSPGWASFREAPITLMYENGVYELWFFGNSTPLEFEPGSGNGFGRATSLDGVNWTFDPTPIRFGFDSANGTGFQLQEVVKIAGTYHAYYYDRLSTGFVLKDAVSTDGANFTNDTIVQIPDGYTLVAATTTSSNGTEYVFAIFNDANGVTHYGISTDGSHFTIEGVVNLPTGLGVNDVRIEDGTIKFFGNVNVGGSVEIGYATAPLPPVTDSVHEGTDTSAVLLTGNSVTGTIDAEPMISDISASLPDGSGGYVDKDWYKVTLYKGYAYTFTGAATSITTGLMDMSLYDQNGTQVHPAVEGANPSFTFGTTSQSGATQTYYLAVSAGGADPAWKTATGNYSLNLNGQATVTYDYATLDAPSGVQTLAYGINNKGQIVGSFSNSHGWHGFLYSIGTYTTIDEPAGINGTDGFGINDAGTLVGHFADGFLNRGYVYSGGTFSALDGGISLGNIGYGINDAGTIVGISYGPISFILRGGVYTFISNPAADLTMAQGINNNDVVVGYDHDGSGYHGFVYQNGTYTNFDDPLAPGQTYAEGINDLGQIVGYYVDNNNIRHGFLDSGGVFTTIDDGLGAGGTVAQGINDAGQIVGYYYDSNNVTHGFLANPLTATTDDVHQGPSTTANLPVNGTVAGTIDAEPMSSDVAISLPDGSGGHVDKDWYRVTLTQGNVYTFTGAATSTTTGLIDISLYGPNGTQIHPAVE